ncbi:insulin receptor substrate 4-like [Panicum virgatum]|uniref:insulin receptor substrate 4-like n=1 Tax=Panicum virgatum TaxID=38727 RepID=UPI0019D65086|nr:insulin receptor substrate 4-like [Panicum virgatum]
MVVEEPPWCKGRHREVVTALAGTAAAATTLELVAKSRDCTLMAAETPLAEEVGSRGWLGEYLDRVATSASSLSGRWSERLSQGRRSHSLRHDDSWRRDPAAAAAKSATPAAVAAPGEEALAGKPGEHRDRDNLAPSASASSLSGRWSQGHRRDESWRWSQGSGLRGREGRGSGGGRGAAVGEESAAGGAGSRSVVREWGGKEGEGCGEREGGGKRNQP